jgi:hypothetical protein
MPLLDPELRVRIERAYDQLSLHGEEDKMPDRYRDLDLLMKLVQDELKLRGAL